MSGWLQITQTSLKFRITKDYFDQFVFYKNSRYFSRIPGSFFGNVKFQESLAMLKLLKVPVNIVE